MLDQPILSPEEEIKRIVARPVVPPAPAAGIVPSAQQAAQSVIAPPTPKVTPVQVPAQHQTDEAELNRLKNSPAGVEQLQHKHPILGTIARIGDAALSSLFPTVAANIPGTELHHTQLVNRAQGRVANDITGEQREAQTANEAATTAHTQAQTGMIPAQTAHIEAETDALNEPKPKEEQWDVVQGFSGPNGEPILKEKNSGQLKLATSLNAKPTKAEKPDTPEQQFMDEYQKTHPGSSIASAIAAYGATSQKPERPQRVLAVTPDNKVIELTPGMTVPKGTRTVAGELKGEEPTADEKRRADLANNMNENLDQLEEIVNRRPDLFGPAAGRITELRGAVGTSDPDIAALKTIHEQMGMAMVGAHAMRNAQHVEAAANAVINGYHNKPDAVKSAIKAARNSLQTFTNDVNKGHAPQQSEPPRPANVPSDYIYQENGPKGKGWYRPTA